MRLGPFVLGMLAVGGAGATCGRAAPQPETHVVRRDGGENTAQAPRRAEFRVFAFARVMGTIAPCGCTTEPLGGLQYAFGYIEAHSEARNRLVLEPGSFLFPEREGPDWPRADAEWAQARDRASLLTERFAGLGGGLVSGIGPTDLDSPQGPAALDAFPMPRVVANVTLEGTAGKEHPLAAHRLVTLHDAGVSWSVGVTAVADPALPHAARLGAVSDPVAATRKAVTDLNAAGADFTVVLAHGTRDFAQTLVGDGVDMVVVGVPQGSDRERLGSPVAQVGGTFVLEPGTALQSVTELVLSVDPGAGGVPDLSAWVVPPTEADLQQQLARVDARLTKFAAHPDADPSFLAALKAERARLRAQLEQPAEGTAVAVFDQVKVTCKLPPDRAAQAALARYDKRVAEANKARFKGVKPPDPPPGQSAYAGIDACADCHQEAVDFWRTTGHAGAYETLVVDNKQFDLDCVGCHVTGFRQPGGSEVVENAGLVDVQCEVCHGPGALHAEDGGDDARLIKLEAPEELCAVQCHTPEHSDTFAYQAYMRDILGPGHGQAKRELLGDGPTGHELRQAGLAKAGGACKKTM